MLYAFCKLSNSDALLFSMELNFSSIFLFFFCSIINSSLSLFKYSLFFSFIIFISLLNSFIFSSCCKFSSFIKFFSSFITFIFIILLFMNFFIINNILSNNISFFLGKSGVEDIALSLKVSKSWKNWYELFSYISLFVKFCINWLDNKFNSLINFSSNNFSFSLLNLVISLFILIFNFSVYSILDSLSNKVFLVNSLIYFCLILYMLLFIFKQKSSLFLFLSRKSLISFENISINSFPFLMHSFFITYFQLFSIIGIPPLLIESNMLCTNSNSIEPEINCPWKDLGFIFLKTLFLKFFACSKNSARNWSSGKNCNFCKFFSSSTGRTNAKQSLSGK